MRSLVLVVAAALAVANCHAYFKFDPMATINAHAFPKSASHVFGALQNSNSTTLSAECQQHYVALLNLSTKCTATLSVLGQVQVGNQTSIDAATSACASSCMTEAKDFFQNSLTEKCLGSGYAISGQVYETYCSKSKTNGELCALTLQKTNVECGRYTSESDCGKIESCLWSASTTKCTRNSQPSKALLDSYCASGCVDKLLDTYKKLDPSSANDVRIGLDAVCLKNGDDYCLPIWNELNSKLTIDGKDRPTFCNNASAFGCLRTYAGFASAQAINSADKSLKSCVGSSKTPSEDTKRRCMQSYLTAVQSADKIVLIIDVICATTDGTANGKPCLPLYANISAETSVSACSKNLDKGNCSDSCDTIFADRMRDLGCCGFFILQISAKPLPDDKRLPATTGGASISFKDANVSTSEASDTFKACPKTKANATLFARCTVAADKRQKKSMKVNMAYAEISKDSALFARLKLALRKDIAASLGISEDAIVNDDVTEDTSRQVTVKVASSRQQSTTTQQKKNAAKYDFSIAGQDEASTNAAAAKFDAQSSAGTLQTTSTASTVSACTSCTDTSGNVVAATSSAAGRVAAFIVAVVAVVATL